MQPERPTVATHAYSVAPGWIEAEAGIELDRNRDGSSAFSAPVTAKLGFARRLQLAVTSTVARNPGHPAGAGDVALGLKWRVGEETPLLGDFALLPSIKLPTGSRARGTGTGTTDLSILAISSRKLGSVEIDLNAGWTRRSGDGFGAPRNATLWAAAAGGTLGGDIGWNLEIFGYPGTSGLAGRGPAVGLTFGPTWQPRPWIAFDAGAIAHISGPQPNAFYAGLTWNVGRLPGRR